MKKFSYEGLYLFTSLMQFVSRQATKEERLNLFTFGESLN